MRVGMQVSGSAIGRVFTQPIAPPRKFRGAIDAGLTLAIGSVCAFALTLGPAPLNTVAASSAAAATFAGYFEPAPASGLLPAEFDDADSERSDHSKDDEADPAPTPMPRPAPETGSAPLTPAPPPAPAPPGAAKKADQAPQPPAPSPAAPPRSVTASAALTVVETLRIASGLAEFVPEDDCTQPVVHASVTVTPNGVLPRGQLEQSLAPDPAHATVGDGPGALSVTVYTCR